METLWDRVDRVQRRHPILGFPVGVAYKFFDDQGAYLAVLLTYYTFTAVFPLLLIASSILGFLLQGDATLRAEVLGSALRQFPIVGTQLGQPSGLRGSTGAIVIGVVAALYGTTGLGQAAQNAINTTLAVPRNSRVNPILARLRSVLLLFVGGLTVLTVAVLTSLASQADGLAISQDAGIQWLLRAASIIITAAVLAGMVAFASSGRLRFRQALPGAMVIAVLWQLLQLVGGVYVQHVLTRVNSMNATFALVLGLVAFLYVASTVAVIGLELNVVLAERLYPRSLATPFTDDVDLTDADRRAYIRYAKAQRFKGFERIEVRFEDANRD
ncbi:MAG: YihY/virulence factor BrkB family protein [Marmoricola sp.]